MMRDDISPEERLLHFIRKDANPSSREDEKAAKHLEAAEVKGISQNASSSKRDSRRGFPLFEVLTSIRREEDVGFNLINRTLLAILFILGIYLLIDFFMVNPSRIKQRLSAFKETEGTVLEMPGEPARAVKPVAYYTQSVKSRNLFTAPGAQSGPSLPSPSFMEMISKLKLQGIISGANPQAIIEDTKTKQTYFLKPGQRIGEIELKQILPGKVLLNYNDQEVELAL